MSPGDPTTESGSRLRPRVRIAFCAAVLFGLAAWPSLVSGDERESRATIRVLAIGDSLTSGVISGEEAPPYVEILRSILGPKFEVVALGCNGSSIRDWLRPREPKQVCAIAGAYEMIVASQTPGDIATILLGTNDAVGFLERRCAPEIQERKKCPVHAAEYESQMNLLIDKLAKDGVAKFILIKPSSFKTASVQARERIVGYGTAIEAICTTRDEVGCGPNLFELLDVDEDFFEGNIHPNASGHRKIGEALAPYVVRSAEARK
jgi:lysophospholipase L1-like esterase